MIGLRIWRSEHKDADVPLESGNVIWLSDSGGL